MIERHLNPRMSYSAEHREEGDGIALRFHDPDTHDLLAELYFDDVERLEGIAWGTRLSSDILVSMMTDGYDATVDEFGLERGMTDYDLASKEELTVEDILNAGD